MSIWAPLWTKVHTRKWLICNVHDRTQGVTFPRRNWTRRFAVLPCCFASMSGWSLEILLGCTSAMLPLPLLSVPLRWWVIFPGVCALRHVLHRSPSAMLPECLRLREASCRREAQSNLTEFFLFQRGPEANKINLITCDDNLVCTLIHQT